MESAKNSSEMIFTDILTEFDEETSLYVTNQSFPAPAPWISDHEELHPIPSPLFLAETGHATAAASPESSLNFSSAFSSPSCSSDEELDGLKRKSIEGSQEEKVTKKRRRRLQEDQAATVEEGRNKPRMRRGSATDPQSVYARKRRERINQRLKMLQNLVPNGTKVDISTMLEQAIEYVKFMQLQIKLLSSDGHWMYAPIAFNGCMSNMDLNSASFHDI